MAATRAVFGAALILGAASFHQRPALVDMQEEAPASLESAIDPPAATTLGAALPQPRPMATAASPTPPMAPAPPPTPAVEDQVPGGGVIEANMTEASKSAAEAAGLAAEAERYARQFREAKTRSRRFEAEAMAAAAAAASASIVVANESVAGATAVSNARGHAAMLDDARLEQITADASVMAVQAAQAADNASRALHEWRAAEAQALQAETAGLAVDKQIALRINDTVASSISAAVALGPLAVATGASEGRPQEAPGSAPAPPAPAAPPPAARAEVFGDARSLQGSPVDASHEEVDPDIVDSRVAAAAEVPKSGGGGPGASRYAGWIAFLALLVGLSAWCSCRPRAV